MWVELPEGGRLPPQDCRPRLANQKGCECWVLYRGHHCAGEIYLTRSQETWERVSKGKAGSLVYSLGHWLRVDVVGFSGITDPTFDYGNGPAKLQWVSAFFIVRAGARGSFATTSVMFFPLRQSSDAYYSFMRGSDAAGCINCLARQRGQWLHGILHRSAPAVGIEKLFELNDRNFITVGYFGGCHRPTA